MAAKQPQLSLIDLFAYTTIFAVVSSVAFMNWFPAMTAIAMCAPFVLGSAIMVVKDGNRIAKLSRYTLALCLTVCVYLAFYDLRVAAIMLAYVGGAQMVVSILRKRFTS